MTLTLAIIIGLSLLGTLIGFDVYLATDDIKGNTWSEILRNWGNKTLLVAWIWGGLAGHFFHPAENFKPIIKPPGNIALLIWSSILITMIGLISSRMGYSISSWCVLPIAFIVWWLLWPV